MQKYTQRTHYCGHLTTSDVGKAVTLTGWVDTRRDHGSLVFIDLRDREGKVQIVLDPSQETTSAAKDLRSEYVITVQGVVKQRPEGMINKKLVTGHIEIEAKSCEILNEAHPLPFQLDDANVSETLRLKYRYLDLRSPRLQNHLVTRHKVIHTVRNFLSQNQFLEVETPILYKSTPEGARDYLVPSRVSPGHFYALPQSPQILKQLLMIAGYDRYFQIARCFRDEDLRADRQPEFSQIDIEMSFVDQADVLSLNEKLLRKIWQEFRGVEIPPIPIMSFYEAMDRFGSDKPDLRFGLEIKDLGGLLTGTDFKVFSDALARKGVVRGLAVPGQASISRAQLDKLTDMAKKSGAKGLVWIKWEKGGVISSSAAKFFAPEKLQEILQHMGGSEGDLGLIVADDYELTCNTLGALRLHFGHELKLIDTKQDKFLWVIDFPLFEYSPDEKRWVARHHPFTSPQDSAIPTLLEGQEDQYGSLLAKAYDLVCNGYELAGGSIRIFKDSVQQAMFRALGFTPEESQRKFGFFLEAFRYGTPPHGGIAWGVDRLIMILTGTSAIREVMAFPKTAKASDLMSEAPSEVSHEQLQELGIRLSLATEKKI